MWKPSLLGINFLAYIVKESLTGLFFLWLLAIFFAMVFGEYICPMEHVTVFYQKTVFSCFFAFVPLKIENGCAIIKGKRNAKDKNAR